MCAKMEERGAGLLLLLPLLLLCHATEGGSSRGRGGRVDVSIDVSGAREGGEAEVLQESVNSALEVLSFFLLLFFFFSQYKNVAAASVVLYVCLPLSLSLTTKQTISVNATHYPTDITHVNASVDLDRTGGDSFTLRAYLGQACDLWAPLVIDVGNITMNSRNLGQGELHFFRNTSETLWVLIHSSLAGIVVEEAALEIYVTSDKLRVRTTGTPINITFADPNHMRTHYSLGTLWCLCQVTSAELTGLPMGNPPIFIEANFKASLVKTINYLGDLKTPDPAVTTQITVDNVQLFFFYWQKEYQHSESVPIAFLANDPQGNGSFAFLGSADERELWYRLLAEKVNILSAHEDIRLIPDSLSIQHSREETDSSADSLETYIIAVIVISGVMCVVILCLLFLRLPLLRGCRDTLRQRVPCCAFLPPSPGSETAEEDLPPTAQTDPPAERLPANDSASPGTDRGIIKPGVNPIDACVGSPRSFNNNNQSYESSSTSSTRNAEEGRVGEEGGEMRPASERSVGPILSRLRGLGVEKARSQRQSDVGMNHGGNGVSNGSVVRSPGMEFVPGPGWENTTDCTEMSTNFHHHNHHNHHPAGSNVHHLGAHVAHGNHYYNNHQGSVQQANSRTGRSDKQALSDTGDFDDYAQ